MSTFEAKTKAARTRKFMITSALTAASAVALSVGPARADDPAPWSQWMDEHGSINISLSELLTLITQNSSIYIGTSGTLNIPEGYTVRITGGSLFAAKAALDADPTRILGSLISDGRVIILDRNGVFFGQNSQVDAAGLIASSGEIDNDQLINNEFGAYTIDNIGADAGARIDLNGTINIADAGLAAFVAPTVSNSGVINARFGKVGFASGERVTIDPYGDNLFEIEVPGEVAALLENTETGQINAEGGVVTMSSQVAEGIVDNLINVDGVVNVSSVTQEGGRIVLSAEGGDVNVSGTLNASGVVGGDIDVRGQNVTVSDSASVNADGVDGSAAGSIDLIADNRLTVAGDVSAQGQTGTGFIETSGYELDFHDGASVLTTGLWLIDPANFTINNFWANQLQNQLAIGNALISTFTGGPGSGHIIVQALISWATNFTLTLNAYGDIIFDHANAGINATGGGNVVMNAGDDIRILGGHGINLNGGTATFDANDLFWVGSGQNVNVNGGIINVIADAFDLDGYLNAGAGAINISRDNDPGSSDDDTNIDIGDSNGSNFLISQDELDRMTAGTLTIGSAEGANNQIRVGNADFRAFNQTVLNTRRDDNSNSQDVLFAGNNFFNALTVNADDDIIFGNNAIVRTWGNTIFNTDTNVQGVGSFTMGTNSFLDTNGYNLTVNTIGVNLLSGAVINAFGGNIDFNNTGIFYSADADSVRTGGTGTIEVNQWVGGSINNAIAAIWNIGSGLNTVFVGPGTFNESVLIDQANLWLQGSGPGSTTIDPNSPGVHIIADNATVTGFTISTGDDGILVDGANYVDIFGNIFTGQTNSAIHAINGSDYLDIWDNDIHDIGGDGILIEGGDYADIWDNNIWNVAYDGIDINDNDHVWIWNNAIYNVGDNGIEVSDSYNAYIGGNEIDETDGHGIYVSNSNSAHIEYNDINTHVGGANTWGSGIYVSGSNHVDINNNEIDDVDGGDGIYVTGGHHVDIWNNDIWDIAGDGIDVNGNNHAWIWNNDIWNVGDNGVEVSDSYDAYIGDNDIEDADGHGIYVSSSDWARIMNNWIWDVGQHGIFVNPSDYVDIAHNEIHYAGWDGIHVDNGDYADIWDNHVGHVGDDGVDVNNNDNVEIWDNYIHDAQGNGIEVSDSYNAHINWNDIEDVWGDGIRLDNSNYAEIIGNDIEGAGDDGIDVRDSYTVDIFWNDINDVDGDGIYVEDSNDAYVGENDIWDVDGHGIYVNSSDWARIMDNWIWNVGQHGIFVNPSDFVDIAYNEIHWAGWDGIHVSGGDFADIWGNHVGFVFGDGIEVDNNDWVDIWDNYVHNVGDSGIEVSDSHDAYIGWNSIWFTGGDGIEVTNSDWADIRHNDVNWAGDDGIDVDGSAHVDVNYNSVHHADNNGIEVTNSFDADIIGNWVRFTGGDGIFASHIFGGDIRWNNVAFTGDDGIDVRNSDWVDIKHNNVAHTWGDGIQVRNSDHADVYWNFVSWAGDDGIDVEHSAWADVNHNVVSHVAHNGIEVTDSFDADIIGNWVAFTGGDGIFASHIFGGDVRWNNVSFTGDDGIDIRNSDWVDVVGNNVWFTWGDGIQVRGSDHVDINGNFIRFAGDDGIDLENSFIALIDGNDIADVVNNGIEVEDSTHIDITNNVVANAGGAGVFVDPSNEIYVGNNTLTGNNIGVQFVDVTDGTIENNTILGSLTTGIHIEGSDDIHILFNDITDSGVYGLHVAGGHNGSVVLVGNTFTNNPVGAFFESGQIDISSLTDPNTFIGGDVAMRFSPFEFDDEERVVGFADLSLVGDTLGATIFEGQSTYYVELLNGALFDPGNPTIIDGRYASYDGIVPITDFPLDEFGDPIIPQDILDAIEALLRDFDDAGTEGQIFVGRPPLLLENVEDFLKKFGAFSPAAARLNITILGLPRVGVSGAGGGVFNAITPFAGGEEGAQPSDERVALIEPAAGGEEGATTTAAAAAAIEPAAGGETNCLAQAVNAATGGTPTSYSYGGTFEDAGLQGISSCGGLQSF